MPRTLTRNSQVYPAGTYGPFALDSFTRNDAEGVEAEFTIEGWPTGAPLLRLTFAFDNGRSIVMGCDGEVRNRDGMPATIWRPRIWFPVDAVLVDGQAPIRTRRQTTSCDVTVEVFQAFRTALTVRAF